MTLHLRLLSGAQGQPLTKTKQIQILYLNLLKQSLMLIDVVACLFDGLARYTQSISMAD